MASTQWQRVQAYCKTIWGADRNFDIEVEEIDEGSYLIFVREDRGTSLGNILVTVGCIKGYARTWNELERHVADLARAKETEGWTPKVQPLDATAYPHFNHDLNAKNGSSVGKNSEERKCRRKEFITRHATRKLQCGMQGKVVCLFNRGVVEPGVAVYSPYFGLNLLEIVVRYK